MSISSSIKKSGLRCLALSAVALPLATTSAAALVTLGDHAALFFNGSATVRYNDNVFLTPDDEHDDWVFILSPGIELNVGATANANVNIYYREDFYRYDDASRLNSNQSNVFLNSYYNMPRLNLRFTASYEELIQPLFDVRVSPGLHALIRDGLVERERLQGNLRGEYEISELFSVASGVSASRVRYKDDIFSDTDSVAVPFNLYYSVTPKWDLSAGYRFRYTDVKESDFRGSTDYRDHYFNVGIRGEVLPKLMGEARVGYQERDFKDADSRSTMAFGADFSYYMTPKLTLLLGASRDFETGGLGQSISATGANLGARFHFNHLISANAGVGYFERNYRDGREDETLDFNVGATYSPNVYVSLSAGYIFRTNDSNIDAVEFDNNIFNLTASLRF